MKQFRFLALTLLGLCTALSWHKPVLAQTQNQTIAEQRFLRGLALYDQRRFAEALEEFRASYALRASPNSRLYIARTLRELDRIPEAVLEFDTTIIEAREHRTTDPRYQPTQEAAQNELRALEPRVARLRLVLRETPPGTQIFLDDREVHPGAAGLPLAVAPGPVTLRIVAPGYTTEQRQLTLVAGNVTPVELTLQPTNTVQTPDGTLTTPSQPQGLRQGNSTNLGTWLARGNGSMRTLFFVSAGVGVGGWVFFGVFGGLGASNWSRLEAQCGNVRCPASELPTIEAGRTFQTLANVSLGVGIAGTAAAVVFLVAGPRVQPVSLAVLPTSHGLSFHGAF